MNKVKKELKEFIEFKNNYNFVQKEIEEKEDGLYCEGEALQDSERKQNK